MFDREVKGFVVGGPVWEKVLCWEIGILNLCSNSYQEKD